MKVLLIIGNQEIENIDIAINLFTKAMNIFQIIDGSGSGTEENALQLWVSISTILSGIAAGFGIYISFIVYRGQKRQNQKQLVIPLWEHMSKLNIIIPEAPNSKDIVTAVNTLELVAVSCKNKIVDQRIIRLIFKDLFIRFVVDIRACGVMDEFDGQNGVQLINNVPIVVEFYNNLLP